MEQILQLVEKPTLLLDESKAKRNIVRMVQKAQQSEATLRPHFKTHQSAEIGEWFRDMGVTAITVSSVDMAEYFIDHGWSDVTIAFPFNPRQVDRMVQLNRRARLNALVESLDAVRFLQENADREMHLWLKVDSGYHRTGIAWDDFSTLASLANAVEESGKLILDGILTHAGHTYGAGSPGAIRSIFMQVMERMKKTQDHLAEIGLEVAISIGDTPSCSVVEDFHGVDEIRPGNFVFYDLSQYHFGSCHVDDIAVAVACPVVAKHPNRKQIVVYGGAIHFSKESIRIGGDTLCYGQVVRHGAQGWSDIQPECLISSLSQEHGIIQATDDLMRDTEVGDVLLILPVHSCLTANLLKSYLTLDGQSIVMAAI